MSTSLEQVILRRVHHIYLLRRVFAPTALKTYSLALCTLALLSAVSVANVVANMPALTAPTALWSFLVHALLNTELVVQLLLVGTVVAVGMLVRDMARGIGTKAMPPFAGA